VYEETTEVPAEREREREREREKERERDETGNKRKEEGEEERGADPDPVTEAGDGTTKSNPPSKIESRRGSVYLMKEKRRRAEGVLPSPLPKIKRIDRVEKRREVDRDMRRQDGNK